MIKAENCPQVAGDSEFTEKPAKPTFRGDGERKQFLELDKPGLKSKHYCLLAV